MIANYHTHTFRCHHARGTEREYIEAAIKAGIRILGFSDHVPFRFPDGHESNYRVPTGLVYEYFDTIGKLRDEYADKIEIHIGFETEYYPMYFDMLMDQLSSHPVEYFILGQHFTKNEIDGCYALAPSTDEAVLRDYTDQVKEAMESGKITYVAHPDILNFVGDEKIYKEYMKELCQCAKDLNIPLEYNFLGYEGHRIYPSDRFFKIAAEVGNKIVLGCDAHDPECLNVPDVEKNALLYLSELDLKVTETVPLVKPF